MRPVQYSPWFMEVSVIYQSDISRMTGFDLTRVSRAATAVNVLPTVAARGRAPGRYRVADAAKVLAFCRLRATGINDAGARAAVELIDEDCLRELAWRDKPLWLVCAAGKAPAIGDAVRVIDYIGEHPAAKVVNLQACLRDVLQVAAERAEKSV